MQLPGVTNSWIVGATKFIWALNKKAEKEQQPQQSSEKKKEFKSTPMSAALFFQIQGNIFPAREAWMKTSEQ